MSRSSCVALAIALAVPGVAHGMGVPIIARVNGVDIPTVQFESYFDDWLAESGKNVGAIRSPALYRRFRREALRDMLDQELLWQEAQKQGVVASREDVESALARVRERFPSREAWLTKVR